MKRWEELLHKHISGAVLTPAEEEELAEAVLNPANEAMLKQVADREMELAGSEQEPPSYMSSRVLSRLASLPYYSAPVISMYQKSLLKRATRWLAAAAVLLFLSGLFYLLKQQGGVVHKGGDDTGQPAVASIQPGSNKATLTLAGGRVIVLDAVASGQLATQGGATIVKLDSGQLAYNAGAPGEITYNTLTTPRGGQYMITLPDGTQVWLNAETSLRFPTAFTGDKRQVELTGEAYFEVAKNAAKPFTVLVNNAAQVKVLGTHFNIMAYKDEARIVTTLLEGSVNMSAVATPAVNKTLAPGQQASYSPAGDLAVNNNADTEQAVAWKNGQLFFRNENIYSLMRQAARWYNVKVQYQGDIKDTYTISVPRDVPMQTLLQMLEKAGGVHFEISGQTITVKPS